MVIETNDCRVLVYFRHINYGTVNLNAEFHENIFFIIDL